MNETTDHPTPYRSPSEIFSTTASWYVRYRRPHPPVLLDLIASMAHEHTAAPRMLDLGCGPGPVSLDLAVRGVDVIALDPSPEMLEAARAEEKERGLSGTDWRQATAENVACLPGVRGVSGAVAADAFHWMDREQVLRQLDEVTAPGGFVALLCSHAAGAPRPWWHELIGQVRARFVGTAPAAGPRESYRVPEGDHESVLRRSAFHQITVTRAEHLVSYSTEELIGAQLTYAYSSPVVLGDQRRAFEDALREVLIAAEPSGRFEYTATAALITGRRG
ncbi:class I SAM-dependent methyltransferase [Streptomyces sp. ET3-23]|uniref:class I SAM-dependent methyltransferase n=1 Tax=Streptomyces sp. ET3-23 TaxID=2885643 RepID=UPI001D0FCD39|nr:class I SAM-dependent methyltransferase [Streptomyces sp. ET3-23]MCC2275902.1 class I SAM-dependent methyltransferase [Streptomyces sp. ET3-23]